MFAWLRKTTFTCNQCGAGQRIPVRRIHFFERFHELNDGQPVLLRCSQCGVGLQNPAPYRSHNGQEVTVDPCNPPERAFIHEVF